MEWSLSKILPSTFDPSCGILASFMMEFREDHRGAARCLTYFYAGVSFVITVVSGLPRSGTSLMMQMLVAGGIPALTDGLRVADANNPKGYFEWEAAKALKQNAQSIAAAEGKVVKVISALLPYLPGPFEYRIIFMMRPLEEVIASQNKMLQRLGKEVPPTPRATVMAAFEKHLRETEAWLSRQTNMTVLRIEHSAVIADARVEVAKVVEFLGRPLDVEKMAHQVEDSLYRERSPAVAR